jgi:myo-inositol-1(or 4)-monophosphatase
MTDATRRGALAERAARAGGVVANETFREALPVETKANKNDVVTEADRDAQRQVVATIRREYPDDALVCEEDVAAPGVDDEILKEVPETGPAWVVDPIDGTANYVRGIRFWGTSVAAVVDAEPVGVATYLPAERDIYTAGPGSVTLNGSAMAVSERTDPETFMTALLGWWPMEGGDSAASLFRAATEQFGDVRRLGSLQGALALVAAGSLDAGFMPETPHPWDAMAGVHMVRRAGGTATDVHGDRWRHDSEGLVVSNGEAHELVLETVREEAPAGAAE